MLAICGVHYSGMYHLANGYLAVEFFFALSGMLIYKSFLKHNEKGAIQYTIDKIKRFYRAYVIVLLPAILLSIVYNYRIKGISTCYDMACDLVPRLFSDLMLIQNIGPWLGGLNLPLWYLSVLIFGGGFIYNLLKVNTTVTVKVILPIFSVLVYTYIFQHGQNHMVEYFGIKHGVLYMPMLRGLADMSIGVLGYHFLINQKEQIAQNNAYQRLINVLAISSVAIVLLLFFIDTHFDEYFILLSVFILFGCFTESGILTKYIKSNIWIKLGGITYEMLLIHNIVSLCLNQANDYIQLNQIILLIIYIGLVISLSFALKRVTTNKSKYATTKG